MEKMEKVYLALKARLDRYPWWVARRGDFGWQVLCRFPTYSQAWEYGKRLCDAYGEVLEPKAITVSHIKDGPALWEIEWAINQARHERNVEKMKLACSPKKVEALQARIQYLIEEAVVVALAHGKHLDARLTEQRMELRFKAEPVLTLEFLGEPIPPAPLEKGGEQPPSLPNCMPGIEAAVQEVG